MAEAWYKVSPTQIQGVIETYKGRLVRGIIKRYESHQGYYVETPFEKLPPIETRDFLHRWMAARITFWGYTGQGIGWRMRNGAYYDGYELMIVAGFSTPLLHGTESLRSIQEFTDELYAYLEAK